MAVNCQHKEPLELIKLSVVTVAEQAKSNHMSLIISVESHTLGVHIQCEAFHNYYIQGGFSVFSHSLLTGSKM
jgi:hypothetical protein